MSISSKNKEKIANRNKDLLDRISKGDSGSLFTQQASAWQPRPLIKKDKKAISKLYKDR
jgi:hypothetical protein